MATELRRANRHDSRFYWEVNNDPAARANSISQEAIPWESHERWFEGKLASSSSLLFVATDGTNPVGVARFDRVEDAWTISIAVAPHGRGRGLGAEIIEAATRELASAFPRGRAVAWIRPSNAASIRAFERAGYSRVGAVNQNGLELEQFEAQLEVEKR